MNAGMIFFPPRLIVFLVSLFVTQPEETLLTLQRAEGVKWSSAYSSNAEVRAN